MIEDINNQPLVAIAVPVYNTEKYFRDCLEHILAQTYQNWICYITDNASTDSSYQIALEFAEKDKRFKVFRNEKTVTAFENWNIALGRMADVPARYIKYECADDWMFPECIERMVALHEKDDKIGAVYAYRLHDKIVDCDGLNIYEGEIFEGKDILLKSMLHGLYIYGGLGSALFRMEALKEIHTNLHVINQNNIHCDIELNDNVLINWKAGFVYEVLTYYRRHDGQILSFAEKTNTILYGIERRLFLHLEKFPDLKSHYQSVRQEYALFLAKCKRKKQTDILAWHNKYLERPIQKSELRLAKRNKRKQLRRDIKMKFIKLFTV